MTIWERLNFHPCEAGTRHLLPNPERPRSEQPVVDSSEQVTAHTEEIEDEAVDSEKSLRVRG